MYNDGEVLTNGDNMLWKVITLYFLPLGGPSPECIYVCKCEMLL